MIAQYEMVVLLHDIPESKLLAGDAGAVVEIYDNGAAYEVEFSTQNGHTFALLALPASAIRMPNANEMYCMRDTSRNLKREALSALGGEFWDNPIDDADWNAPDENR